MSRPNSAASTFRRDPVSELLDQGARALLDRAYAAPGRWVSTRLADPSADHIAYFGSLGIDVTGPDNAPRRGGKGLDAHTRWARGFVRALYYQHLWYSKTGGRGWRGQRRTAERSAGALQIQVGPHRPELGVIPAGRIVRVILHPGGRAALAAAQAAPASIFTPSGGEGSAAADARRRDW